MTEDPDARPYTPIDCSLHDRLEALATVGRASRIVYRGSAGESTETVDRIVDVYARGGEEYVKTAVGLEIRLDRLVSVDGVAFETGGEDGP